MASRDRYVRILVGYAERFIEAGGSLPAIGLLFLLFTFSAKRTIQGASRIGVAGLAEALDMAVPKLEKLLRALEQAGAIEFDRKARLLYVVGAVKASGPQTVQSVIAHHRDFSELPECGPKRTIERELLEVLAESDPKLMAEWQSQVKAYGKAQPQTNAMPSVTPVPHPIPLPEEPLPPAAAMYAAGWSRLPDVYPDAAAADFIRASNEIPEEQFELLLALLVCGKFVNPLRWNLTGPTPTLRRILESEKLRTQILNREFFDPGANARCPSCDVAHRLLTPCPSECRGCGRRHSADDYCQQLKRLEWSEQQETETTSDSHA